MSKVIKQLEKMRENPRDWHIRDFMIIADRVGIEYRRPRNGGSHVTFRIMPGGRKLTVPDHKPIKAVYTKLFIELIDEVRGKTS